jgi:hypothetical protein
MWRLKPNGKGIAVFAAGLVIGLGAAIWWATMQPRSYLTANLPANWNEASAVFDARVRTRFPVGTPIPRFTSELDAEGFKPTWHETDGEYGAKRHEGDFVCNIVARVYWRAGKNDAVAAVRGLYHEEGCL